jgi:hypothetical protein
MAEPSGRNLPLSLPRRVICDLMDFSRPVPFIAIERRMRLAAVAEARQAAQPRPGWCAILMKAFAAVAARRAELRRAYFPYPWPHLYEHPQNIATVAVERPLGEEQTVFFGQVRTPERQPLEEIESHLHRYKEQPLESIGCYRRTLRVAALPRVLRRLMWWHAYHSSGRRRAKYLGTFGVSLVGGLGGSLLFLRSPLTATITGGVLDADGSMEVRLNFDHRVLDGGDAARALVETEHVLRGEILAELRYLRTAAAA